VSRPYTRKSAVYCFCMKTLPRCAPSRRGSPKTRNNSPIQGVTPFQTELFQYKNVPRCYTAAPCRRGRSQNQKQLSNYKIDCYTIVTGCHALRAGIIQYKNPTRVIRAAKKNILNLDCFCHFFESLYAKPKESKGFTSGARQTNPGFTESRGWQWIPNPGLPTSDKNVPRCYTAVPGRRGSPLTRNNTPILK